MHKQVKAGSVAGRVHREGWDPAVFEFKPKHQGQLV